MNRLIKKFTFVFSFICFFGVAVADQDDKRLDSLFNRLQSDVDMATISQVEAKIWDIWIDSGREDINALMAEGVQDMQMRDFDAALDIFNQVIEMAPEFAEAWNKRATVYYLRNQLSESVEDIQRTLALEPRHFGALSGMGLIFMQMGDDAGALKAYEEVIKIHPHSPSARYHIDALKAKLRNQII